MGLIPVGNGLLASSESVCDNIRVICAAGQKSAAIVAHKQ